MANTLSWPLCVLTFNIKTNALSCQFSPDPASSEPGPILSPSCIMGATSWQVAVEGIGGATKDFASWQCPPPKLCFVPDSVHSDVLQWEHSSRYIYYRWTTAVDFVTSLPPSIRNSTILMRVNQFTKTAHFLPLRKLPSAVKTLIFLVWHVFHL